MQRALTLNFNAHIVDRFSCHTGKLCGEYGSRREHSLMYTDQMTEIVTGVTLATESIIWANEVLCVMKYSVFLNFYKRIIFGWIEHCKVELINNNMFYYLYCISAYR